MTIEKEMFIIKEKKMKLTSQRGKDIREEYVNVKEKEVCDVLNYEQKGGSRTKIDGSSETNNASIKNFSGQSTQVHLTTQKHFIKILGLDDNCGDFIKKFCGNEFININGNDRYYISEIEPYIVESFLNFLNNNKNKVIELIICNGFQIDVVAYRNLKTNKIYQITYDEILKKIEDCKWVAKKGGIHLKTPDGKTYFHLQREGKKKKKNRYNVLFHIHKNIFL